MKKLFISLSITLISFVGYSGNTNLKDSKLLTLETSAFEDLFDCTVSTTRNFTECNGDTHTVTVTNTGTSCFEAWSSNQDQLNEFEDGIACE